MITEDYVSFETAKLLKEKGFNEFTYSYYSKDDEESEPKLCMENLCSDNWNGVPEEVNDLWFSAPTLQMAMKWLREEKNTIINVWNNGVDWDAEYYNNEDENFYFITTDSSCNSYEEAAEAGIKYCLEKLI